METEITLDDDITVLYVTADSFPEGIRDAHRKLHEKVPFIEARRYFGVSRPENDGDIVYRAAAEEMHPGEGRELGLDTLVIKNGRYISTVLQDYMQKPEQISWAFDELLEHADIDPEGYCVEWYLSKTELRCMVRLEE